MPVIARLILFLLALSASHRSIAQEDAEKAISAMLAKMSLEEKVGQMTQLTLGGPFKQGVQF